MQSPAFEIAKLLEAQGVGVFGSDIKWSINVNQEPVAPSDCITLFDTGSLPYSPEPKIFEPTIQVRVRSVSHQEGYRKQDQIRAILVDFVNQDFEQSRYIGLWLTSGVLSLGTDETDRYITSSNYRVQRQTV